MLDKKNFYINGAWVAPKKPNDFKVIDPSTEEECAVISLGGVDDVNAALVQLPKLLKLGRFLLKKKD
jgi:aldehyde dehydrogenase (NAD+)